VGNDAAHAEDVTEDEVKDLIDFITELLDQLYGMPERLRAAAERRQTKKAQAAKKGSRSLLVDP
jgi:predicted site-specific integrase-resolvase